MKALIDKITAFEKKFKQNNQDDALISELEAIYESIKNEPHNQDELKEIYDHLHDLGQMFDNAKEQLHNEKISLLARNHQLKRYIINSNVKPKK